MPNVLIPIYDGKNLFKHVSPFHSRAGVISTLLCTATEAASAQLTSTQAPQLERYMCMHYIIQSTVYTVELEDVHYIIVNMQCILIELELERYTLPSKLMVYADTASFSSGPLPIT